MYLTLLESIFFIQIKEIYFLLSVHCGIKACSLIFLTIIYFESSSIWVIYYLDLFLSIIKQLQVPMSYFNSFKLSSFLISTFCSINRDLSCWLEFSWIVKFPSLLSSQLPQSVRNCILFNQAFFNPVRYWI